MSTAEKKTPGESESYGFDRNLAPEKNLGASTSGGQVVKMSTNSNVIVHVSLNLII